VPLNRFTTVKTQPVRPDNMAWKRNGLFLAITNTAEMTNDATFHNGIVQWVDFRLIRSHCAIAELLRIAQLRKNSPSKRFIEVVTVRLQRTWILQK
jgi:hypothetical protein